MWMGRGEVPGAGVCLSSCSRSTCGFLRDFGVFRADRPRDRAEGHPEELATAETSGCMGSPEHDEKHTRSLDRNGHHTRRDPPSRTGDRKVRMSVLEPFRGSLLRSLPESKNGIRGG